MKVKVAKKIYGITYTAIFAAFSSQAYKYQKSKPDNWTSFVANEKNHI